MAWEPPRLTRFITWRSSRERPINDGVPVSERVFAIHRIPLGTKEKVKGVGGDVGDSTILESPWYSFEPLVGNEMELRRHKVRVDVTNETNGGRMDGGETEKLAAVSAGFPFGDFLAVL